MKKSIVMCLVFVLCLSLFGCGRAAAPAQPQQQKLPVDQKAMGEIRYAISLLLDRNYIASAIGQAGQQPASSFVAMGMTDADGTQFYENAGSSPDYPGYFSTAEAAYEENYARGYGILQKYYDYDENTGKFLNFPSLTYLYNTSESHKAVGEYVQMVLSSIGIPVQLETRNGAPF